MLRSSRAPHGMITAPHQLAAQAGLSVLREGGNAIEAILVCGAAGHAVTCDLYRNNGFTTIPAPGPLPAAGKCIASRCV